MNWSFLNAGWRRHLLPMLIVPAGWIVGAHSIAVGQAVETAVLPITGASQATQSVLIDRVMPGNGKQVLVVSGDGVDVHVLAANRRGFENVARINSEKLGGLVSVARLARDGPASLVVADATGVFRLSPGQAPERLFERALAIQPRQGLLPATLNWDFNADGMDEWVLPEPDRLGIYRHARNGGLEPVGVPPALENAEFRIEVDDVPGNPVLPPARRMDSWRVRGPEFLAHVPPDFGQPAAVVIGTLDPDGGTIRYSVHAVRGNSDFATRTGAVVPLPVNRRSEDVPVRCGDGRIRILRATGNLDIVNPRTEVALYDGSGAIGRWVSRDPIGLGIVAPLRAGEGPALVLAAVDFQAGSIPDVGAMATGRPLKYRLQIFGPTNKAAWDAEPCAVMPMQVAIDPSYQRTENPFGLADMDGDGFADLWVRQTQESLSVHKGLGDCRFTSQAAWTVPLPPDGMLDFLDIDDDGAMDVVVSSRSRGELRVVTFQGRARGGLPRLLPTGR